ncbi:MAG: hypothetical protein K0U66_02555 [Gammaproteobacteria bacterium]|nr:hypothetical protein [Gammaproteobacteria bacterium]
MFERTRTNQHHKLRCQCHQHQRKPSLVRVSLCAGGISAYISSMDSITVAVSVPAELTAVTVTATAAVAGVVGMPVIY